jgi:excisionase family DNA binding protein
MPSQVIALDAKLGRQAAGGRVACAASPVATSAPAPAQASLDGQSGSTMSVDEFCERNGMSRSTFYKLVRKELGPRTMKIGRKIRITIEADQEWRRNMERQPTLPFDESSNG